MSWFSLRNLSFLGLTVSPPVILGFWIFLVILTALAVERLKAAGSEKSYLLFSRSASGDYKVLDNAVDQDGAPRGVEDGGIRTQAVGDGNSASSEKEKDEKTKA